MLIKLVSSKLMLLLTIPNFIIFFLLASSVIMIAQDTYVIINLNFKIIIVKHNS